MNASSLLFILLGGVLITYGIGTENMGNFLDLDSVLITFGGTFAAVCASFPVSMLKTVPSHMKIILLKKKYRPADYIDTIIELAQEARKKGLLAIEERANDLSDPFFRNSVMLIVDAIEQTKVRQMLESDLNYLDERHAAACSIYDKGAAFAPAFGMIGTLIGLINMLRSLDLNSGAANSNLGQGMAVALITTFYGSLLANLVLLPIANTLRSRHEEEILCKEMIIEGVISIQSGENPKHIQEKLLAFVAHKQREKVVSGEGKKTKGDRRVTIGRRKSDRVPPVGQRTH